MGGVPITGLRFIFQSPGDGIAFIGRRRGLLDGRSQEPVATGQEEGVDASVPGGQVGTPVYCSQCRQPSTARAHFCPHCGARMGSGPATAAPSYRGQQSTMLPANYLPANTEQRA